MTFSDTTIAFSGTTVIFNGTTVAFGTVCCCEVVPPFEPGECRCFRIGTSGSHTAPYAGYAVFGANEDDESDNTGSWTITPQRDNASLDSYSNAGLAIFCAGTTYLGGFPRVAYIESGMQFGATASGLVNFGAGSGEHTPAGTSSGGEGFNFPCGELDVVANGYLFWELMARLKEGEQIIGTAMIATAPDLGTCATPGGTLSCGDRATSIFLFHTTGTACVNGASFSPEIGQTDITLEFDGTANWTMELIDPANRCSWVGTKPGNACYPPDGAWDAYPLSSFCSSQFGPGPFPFTVSFETWDLVSGEVLS